MKKYMILILLVSLAFAVSGCVIRTSSYEVDRVDQELKGNRGVIYGQADSSGVERKKTRTMYDIEIELFSFLDHKKKAAKKTDSTVVKKESASSADNTVCYTPTSSTKVLYQSAPAQNFTCGTKSNVECSKKNEPYVIEKGDTLQKISQKFFGTTKKWKKIFEANKTILKSPDMIKPGQTINIPVE